ncbi:MAG TPA: hypothetical protein VKO67_08275 [Smithellaceae bacterium]|nr:hypothetical protein [Smithellaceae bacterium]
MSEDLLDYWQRMIRPVFPANAWVKSSLSGGDHVMQIDWNLEDDRHKLNRRSRKIEIIIKEEFIDDYLDKSKDDRALYEVRMKKWISDRYHDFCLDQENETAYSATPVKWRISKDALRP